MQTPGVELFSEPLRKGWRRLAPAKDISSHWLFEPSKPCHTSSRNAGKKVEICSRPILDWRISWLQPWKKSVNFWCAKTLLHACDFTLKLKHVRTNSKLYSIALILYIYVNSTSHSHPWRCWIKIQTNIYIDHKSGACSRKTLSEASWSASAKWGSCVWQARIYIAKWENSTVTSNSNNNTYSKTFFL